jgi:5-methylcytosine-specific restriction endonuclease McrA
VRDVEYLKTLTHQELLAVINSSANRTEMYAKFGIRNGVKTACNVYLRNLGLIPKNWDDNAQAVRMANTNNGKVIKDRCHERFVTIVWPLLFTENSTISPKAARQYIARYNKIYGWLKHECQKCRNEGFWLGKPITLQLDHKNGIGNDHRIENMRYLCPNCHSQTDTFTGRNKRNNILRALGK